VLNADARALQSTPVAGTWTARVDEGQFSARFDTPETPSLLVVECSAPEGLLTLSLARGNLPAPPITLRLISATRTLELQTAPARPTYLVSVRDSAPEHDLLISTLGTPGESFALDVGGIITTFPWDDALATTLGACR